MSLLRWQNRMILWFDLWRNEYIFQKNESPICCQKKNLIQRNRIYFYSSKLPTSQIPLPCLWRLVLCVFSKVVQRLYFPVHVFWFSFHFHRICGKNFPSQNNQLHLRIYSSNSINLINYWQYLWNNTSLRDNYTCKIFAAKWHKTNLNKFSFFSS